MYLNKAFVYGNITRDPELRSLPSGHPVTNFSVATNRTYKDRNGQRQESTEFHNIVVFGRQAETVSQYLRKGSSVLVEGRLQTRSWEGGDGQKRSRTEIVADRVQFGPKGGGGGGAAQAPQKPAGEQQSQESESGSTGSRDAQEMDTIEYPEEDSNPDDIPF